MKLIEFLKFSNPVLAIFINQQIFLNCTYNADNCCQQVWKIL